MTPTQCEALEAAHHYILTGYLDEPFSFDRAELIEKIKAARAEPEQDKILKMIAHRARTFPNYPLGYHIPEIFAAVGEAPPEPTAEPEQEPITVLAGSGAEMFKKLVAAAEKLAIAARWGCVGPDAYDVALDEFRHLASHVCTGIDSPPSPQPREWKELSEEDFLKVCVTAGFDAEKNPALSWREAVLRRTSNALRAKNGL